MSHQESLIPEARGGYETCNLRCGEVVARRYLYHAAMKCHGDPSILSFLRGIQEFHKKDFVRPRLCSCLRTVAENQGFLPRAKGKTSATQSLRHQKWGKIYCTYSKQNGLFSMAIESLIKSHQLDGLSGTPQTNDDATKL